MPKFGDFVKKLISRRKKQPERLTDVYPQIYGSLSLGSSGRKRPVIKPTASNLRRFARSTYARCAINTIKNPIAHMKWEIIPKPDVKLSSEIQRQLDITTACFRRPNNDDSFGGLIAQVVEDYLVAGAGAIEQQRSSDLQRIVWLYPVDGLSIQINPGWDGDAAEPRYYQVIGFGGNIGGIQGTPLRNDELIYIRRDPTTDSPFGVGALEVAYNTLNSLLATQEYSSNVASNAQPENVIFLKKIGKEAMEALKRYWRDDVEGQGITPLISTEEGGEIAKLHGGGDSALYLKYQELKIREIAAAFQISPMNMGLERDVNRNTAETSQDRDWDTAIIPTALSIESHLNRECIEGKLGFSQIMFRFVGVEREDMTATAERYAIEYENNCTTPNEYRSKTGRPPLASTIGDKTKSEIVSTNLKG